MRVILALMVKEFRQIRREPMMRAMIFGAPIVMTIVLGSALTTDIDHLSTAITDLDHTPLGRSIVESFVHSDLFDVLEYPDSPDELEMTLRGGKASLGIIIPQGFSRRLHRGENPDLAIWIDGVDSNAGQIGGGYAAGLLIKTSRDLMNDVLVAGSLPPQPRFKIQYNPELESRLYMIPGIVAVIVLMITSLLSSMSIVREREIGTLEQLMVTPIRSIELMFGKILPFMILGFFELLFALLVGKLVFAIPFVGSILDLLGMAVIFLLTTLGTGLFVSTITSTQQQAMFFAWFFNLFAILMSGIFFPISNMPMLLQRLTLINPLRYFVTIIREIVLKGASWHELWLQVAALFVLGGLLFLTAAIRFNKRID
jgi:ABC-2 type transport system permease protein